MEKQQEILFSIVSESRNNAHRNSYPPQSIPMQQMSYQIDPFLRMSSESKLGSVSSSAFKQANGSPKVQNEQRQLITPTPHQAPISPTHLSLSKGLQGSGNQHQLLSEICATLMGKQM